MTDLSGVAGEDYVLDPVTGQWGPSGNTFGFGTRINSIPQPQPQPSRIINTPSSQPEFADPSVTGYSLEPMSKGALTTTPNSRSGEPAPGIRNLPANRLGAPTANPMTLPIGGPLLTGGALLAGAPTTDQGLYNQANSFNDWFNGTTIGKWLNAAAGAQTPHWGPAHPGSPTNPMTQTGAYNPSQIGPRVPIPPSVPPPTPPGGWPLPPPRPPGPFVRGPLPVSPNMPNAQAPSAQRAPQNINLGYGAPAAAAPSPMFTTIDRPNADIVGGRSVAGQLAPQYFTPAREPGGPAQMGALDLSRLFSRPQPPTPTPPPGAAPAQTGGQGYNVAGMFNNLPNNTFNQGGASAPRVARAPAMQRQPFFANPRNWQYPNIPF